MIIYIYIYIYIYASVGVRKKQNACQANRGADAFNENISRA
jgi:hypothetical protein